ncbi:unnamed protein product [Rhizophagus irregularis]|uniref:Uncharacterized protein n=1 Tax=Rhizophagus irregularis TaxID=588596 RepID=A0A2I1GR78_9GLOM|nr:hypothetical protein RhiirA4_464950 [Rhizophagus irregularis]CAB4440556.1 unnamed protein product [Rhizophagus irregularis]
MEIVGNFYNEFNQFKSRNVLVNNTLDTKKTILNEIFQDSNEEEGIWIKRAEETKDVSDHLINLFEQKDKIMNNTFTLTENVLKLLQRKEIFRFRDKVSDFNDEVEKRLGHDTWKEIVCIYNRRVNTGKDFKSEDYEYLTKLEEVLNKVNITKVEFELLFRMKRTSNCEFHQDRKKRTLDQELDSLEVSFPNELKDLKIPLKKLLLALKKWWD